VTRQVVRIAADLPDGFRDLAGAARAEGYNFLDRLGSRWTNGAYDGDHDASVLAVFGEDRPLAIGAQTYDEYDPSPDHRRIRHFYVHPDARRSGVGRTLAGALIQDAFQLAPYLHLRATHALSTVFWDAMGFERVDRPDRSHRLVRL
jgi:GNAT superfamily N-acetyltransferase